MNTEKNKCFITGLKKISSSLFKMAAIVSLIYACALGLGWLMRFTNIEFISHEVAGYKDITISLVYFLNGGSLMFCLGLCMVICWVAYEKIAEYGGYSPRKN